MCGIVGYIGERYALPVLVNSLKRMEYRGYDSCGIALNDGAISVFKDKGRIGLLEEKLPPSKARLGIGHTRWATHGEPSQSNAHPHLDCSGRIAVVHNGIIANFQELKERLLAQKHIFTSETDTEVISHLIESYYQGNLLEAVNQALREISGSYAIAVVCQGNEEIIVARNESPLVIGIGDREFLVASDMAGVLDYTRKVICLEDGDTARINRNGIEIFNNQRRVTRREEQVPWTPEEAQKGGYEHFMLKEIHEQPAIISEMVRRYSSPLLGSIETGLLEGENFNNIVLLGCGTSYHAALAGKYIFEKLASLPVRVELASEFNYNELSLPRSLVIALSQSGETADTVKALRKAREKGCSTLAITNVVASSLIRVADKVFYLTAGPEISVAATKSFTAQLVSLYLLALSLEGVEPSYRRRLSEELRKLPVKMAGLLEKSEEIAKFGKYLSEHDNVFCLGRGVNLPVALEAALKLKEIAYIHAEGYAAGELKHGPMALLDPSMPVIALVAKDNTYDITLTNIKEVKARGAPVIAIASEEDSEIRKYADYVIGIPDTDPFLTPVMNAVVVQLLAYFAAREKGCSIDMPRNLAKSVTVE